MSNEVQTYDPYELVDDVIDLLRERGLSPERVDVETPAARITGASLLLRGLGIQPARALQDVTDLDGGARYNARMHGD
jgi:hypothetical protein